MCLPIPWSLFPLKLIPFAHVWSIMEFGNLTEWQLGILSRKGHVLRKRTTERFPSMKFHCSWYIEIWVQKWMTRISAGGRYPPALCLYWLKTSAPCTVTQIIIYILFSHEWTINRFWQAWITGEDPCLYLLPVVLILNMSTLKCFMLLWGAHFA